MNTNGIPAPATTALPACWARAGAQVRDRPEAYGTVDEASACLGLARAQAQDERVRGLVMAVQRDLYNLMADLATVPETATRAPWLAAERLDWLEAQTDALGAEVEMPRAFIVPGDSLAGATLDSGAHRDPPRRTAGRPAGARGRAARRHPAQIPEPPLLAAVCAGAGGGSGGGGGAVYVGGGR